MPAERIYKGFHSSQILTQNQVQKTLSRIPQGFPSEESPVHFPESLLLLRGFLRTGRTKGSSFRKQPKSCSKADVGCSKCPSEAQEFFELFSVLLARLPYWATCSGDCPESVPLRPKTELASFRTATVAIDVRDRLLSV